MEKMATCRAVSEKVNLYVDRCSVFDAGKRDLLAPVYLPVLKRSK